MSGVPNGPMAVDRIQSFQVFPKPFNSSWDSSRGWSRLSCFLLSLLWCQDFSWPCSICLFFLLSSLGVIFGRGVSEDPSSETRRQSPVRTTFQPSRSAASSAIVGPPHHHMDIPIFATTAWHCTPCNATTTGPHGWTSCFDIPTNSAAPARVFACWPIQYLPTSTHPCRTPPRSILQDPEMHIAVRMPFETRKTLSVSRFQAEGKSGL